MGVQQSDYILRQIEQAGAALRRLAGRFAARGSGVTEAEEIALEAASAQAALLGPAWEAARAVDAATAVAIVGDRAQCEVWLELIRLEAQVWRSCGEDDKAARLEERAKAVADALGELK